MATAHIHQKGTTEIVAVVFEGHSIGEVKQIMEAAQAGAGAVLNIMGGDLSARTVEKARIKKITYTAD